jgi:DNA-binding transcriptional MerR regulator
MDKYIKSKQVCEELKVHPRTLYQWEKKGWIETI